MIVKTLEGLLKGATHWSTRSMAKEVGLTQTAVSRIWRVRAPNCIARSGGSSRRIRCSSRRSVMSSGSTSHRPSGSRALRR